MMLIKSISHSTTPFKKIIGYMEAGQNKSGSLRIFHNIHSFEPSDIAQEFHSNFLVKETRSSSVKFYHEILSWHPDDKSEITEDILHDLSRKYLELRCPEAQAYLVRHSSDHEHIHALIGANNIGSKKALRLSKKEFKAVKVELESYQKSHFPQLQNSICFDKEPSHKTPPRITPHQTVKQELSCIVAHAFDKAVSERDFHERLSSNAGIALYSYRDNVVGISFQKKKFRFRNFLSKSQLTVLKHLSQLERFREQENERKEHTIEPKQK